MKKIISKIKSFRFSPGRTSIKQITFIIAVALLLIGLVWLIGGKENWQGKKNLIYLSALLEKENIKIAMPEGFPKNLPLIEPANISRAYLRDEPAKDITIEIESKKSAKENYDYYLNYGRKNNWQIAEARKANDTSAGKLLLRKENLTLSFSFTDKKEKGGSEIIISSTVFNLTADKFINPFLNPVKPKEEKIPAKDGQIPEGFPKDFPLNGQTEITEAYTLKVENQAGAAYVIKFKSEQTKETNVKFYQDWFKNNNWFLGEQKSEGEATIIAASRPFVNAVEVKLVQLSDSASEVEVKYRGFK